MRVILDECLPHRLRHELPGHIVSTVQHNGWAGLKNGALLAKIDRTFDAFITIDKNLTAQQANAARTFGIVVLTAPSNKMQDLKPLAPGILAALTTLRPGQIVRVTGP